MTTPFLFLLFSTMTPSPIADRPIARFAGVTINYYDIAAERSIPFPPSPRKDPAVTDDHRFHAIEQERLRLRIGRLALDFAARREGIDPTQKEIDEVLSPRVRDEAAYRRSFEPELAMARSARRVLRGEDARKVFEEDLARYESWTFSLFENRLLMFRTEEIIDRFLSKDQAALTRGRMFEDARRVVIIRRLRTLIETRARENNTSLDDAKTSYWSELLRDADAEILDPTFQLPDWKGIL